MRNYLVNILLATIFVFTVNIKSVVASEPNITQIQCHYVEDEDDLANFAFWLDGYISGLNQGSFAGPEKIEYLIEETLKACIETPEKAVFDIVKRLKQ